MSFFCNHKCFSREDINAAVEDAVKKKTAELDSRLREIEAYPTHYGYLRDISLMRELADKVIVRLGEEGGRPEWFIRAIVEQINALQLEREK